MKNKILVVLFLCAPLSTVIAKDTGYDVENENFHGAEIHCLDKGHSWPGFLTGKRDAQLQRAEMILCIETEINVRMRKEAELVTKTDKRLLEIEKRLQELRNEREQIIRGG